MKRICVALMVLSILAGWGAAGDEPAPAAEKVRCFAGQGRAVLKIADWKDALGDPKEHTIIGDLKIIDRFPIPQLHRLRRIWIWLPPGYENSGRRYPVLYMQDGQNVFDRKTSYAGEWQVDESLAALLGAGKAPAAIAVAVDNGRELRMREYVPAALSGRAVDEGEQYAEFLARTLKSYIDAHFRTLQDRDHTAVAGSSAGAAISFYAGVKYPEVFSRVGAFSFVISKDFIGNIFQLWKLFPRDPALLMRFYLHVEPGGVHNEVDWAKRFPPAYEWLFKEFRSFV